MDFNGKNKKRKFPSTMWLWGRWAWFSCLTPGPLWWASVCHGDRCDSTEGAEGSMAGGGWGEARRGDNRRTAAPPHPARDPAFRTPSLEPLLESNQLQAWQSRMSADESLDDWLNWPHARKCHILFIFIIKNFCYWSMVVLQCDVSFCCIANWVSYTHKYTPVCHHRALARVPCAM